MRVVLLNGPDLKKDAVMIRSGDRWPHRIPRKVVKEVYHSYPFWFAHAASLLKARGHEPIYIDSIFTGFDIDQTVDQILSEKADVVAIATSTPTIKADLTVAERLKARNPRCFTLLVDTHASVFHKEIVSENAHVDAVARGEFEVTIADVADALAKQSGLGMIPGLTWQDGGPKVNIDRPLLHDLDSLPWPDRDIVDQRQYRSTLAVTDRCYMVMSSRGCPFRCTFCLWVPVMFNNKVRLRSVDKVLDEVLHVKNHYGAKEIFFHDDTVNISVKRMEELAQAFIDRKADIPWIANMRADQSTAGMYKLMKKAGCHKVLIGVESGSQALLDAIQKKITIEQIRASVAYAREAGITTHCTFLLGIPGETHATLTQTSRFMRELKPDDIQVSIMTPYPGTPYFEMVKHKRSEWDTFDGSLGESFCDLSSEDLRNAVNRFYMDHYLAPRTIARRLLKLRSWEDVRGNWVKFKTFVGRYMAAGLPRRLDGSPSAKA